jgi:hypothetical protein
MSLLSRPCVLHALPHLTVRNDYSNKARSILPSYNAAQIAASHRRDRKRLTLKINDPDDPRDHNCLLVMVMVAAVFVYKKKPQ